MGRFLLKKLPEILLLILLSMFSFNEGTKVAQLKQLEDIADLNSKSYFAGCLEAALKLQGVSYGRNNQLCHSITIKFYKNAIAEIHKSQ